MTVRLECLGTTFSVVTDSDEARQNVADLWSRCLADGREEPVAEFSFKGQGDEADRTLLTQLTTQAIAEAIGQRLMIHAAGVADEHGCVLALAGRSGSGKTTSAVLLTRDHGFGYVTDETVAVLDDRSVIAFPRPLAVREAASGREVVQSPDRLGLRGASGSLRLERVVLLDRTADDGASSELVSVPLLDAVLELIPQISALPSLGKPLQRLCRLVHDCGGAFRLTYSSLGAPEANLLRAHLEKPRPSLDMWAVLDLPADDDVARNVGLCDGRIRQGGTLDAVRIGADALLLLGSTPIHLSGIGVTVWEAAADAPTLDELVARVVEEHGPHPDADVLVREAVEAMVEAKVLGYGLPVTIGQFLASLAPRLAPATSDAGYGSA